MSLALLSQVSATYTTCEPFTNTDEGLRRMRLHYQYLTHLKTVPPLTPQDQSDEFVATATVEGQPITFKATIPRKASPGKPQTGLLTMTNGIKAGFGQDQHNVGFRYRIILKSWQDKKAPHPDFIVDAKTNCQALPEDVHFTAEDVLSVFVLQEYAGAGP